MGRAVVWNRLGLAGALHSIRTLFISQPIPLNVVHHRFETTTGSRPCVLGPMCPAVALARRWARAGLVRDRLPGPHGQHLDDHVPGYADLPCALTADKLSTIPNDEARRPSAHGLLSARRRSADVTAGDQPFLLRSGVVGCCHDLRLCAAQIRDIWVGVAGTALGSS